MSLLTCLLFVWQGAGAATALLAGDNFLISGGDGSHSVPAIAVNPGGKSFLVAWTSTEANPVAPTVSVNRVFARLVSTSGALLSGRIVVSQRFLSDVTLGGSNPRVAYNAADDEYLVVYERNYEGVTENGIFAQRIGPDGALRGGEIALFPSSGQTSPVLDHDSSANRYLAVWNGLGNTSMYGVLLANDGSLLGPVGQMGPIGQVTRNPAIAFDANTSRYLLVYETNLAGVADIESRFIDTNGLLVSAPVAISAAAGAQTSPQIMLNANGFLVTWTDGGTSVKAQLVDHDGTLSGGNVLLTNNAKSPRIAYSNRQKRYLLNWVSSSPGTANSGFLLGRFLQPNLTSKSALFKVSETSELSGAPALAVFQPDSLALAVWSRKGSDGIPKIWGQLVDLSTQFAKLSIAVSPSTKSVSAGAPLTYTVRVKNSGAALGQSVSLTDTIPDGATLVSATPSVGSCSHDEGTVTCELGNMAVNAAATVSLVVTPSRLGTNRNKAVLDWGNNASDPAQTTVTTKVKVVYPGTLSLVAPDGGETLPTGSSFDVVWDLQGGLSGDTPSYRLQYSVDKGSSWKTVANGLSGTSYRWTVPSLAGNRPKSLVRVTGFNRDKDQIGKAQSEAPFAIEVVSLDAPAAGDVVNSGHAVNVIWNSHATKAPVAKVELSYSLNGGKQWRRMAVLPGDPGAYAWTVPAISNPANRSRVKVVLKRASGAVLGTAISGAFTILP